METVRKIKTILKSRATMEGAGVRLKRSFGNEHVPQFDPFLLLDEFRSDNEEDYIKGFPWHPHRGIETITYMIQGSINHGDSMGNSGVITTGDVQWMTAGSGIIHQEMPAGDKEGKQWGLQLWANLPSSHKMMEPRYREIKESQIPKVTLNNGVVIKVIAGEIEGEHGPVQDIVIDPEYMDIEIPPGEQFTHKVTREYTVFAYVLEGGGYFDGATKNNIGNENLVLYEDGDSIAIEASAEGVRFLLLSGKPLGEPVAWYGPIVMNTNEELQVAFDEYEKGTFVK
jgi:quercetin 2,3-dioxygenase